LSPELYLRRPPSQNELWRLDRILKRKAEAGVKIFVIVYKGKLDLQFMSLQLPSTTKLISVSHSSVPQYRGERQQYHEF
jgi:phospholipase D1/2